MSSTVMGLLYGNGSDGSAHRDPETGELHRAVSVDHLLKLFHGESPHRFAGWLRLKDAWLLGEGVNALTSWSGRLLLQLQVQRASELEGTVFLQLVGRDRNDALDNGLHVLRLQPSGFGDGAISLRCSHDTTGGLHRLHRFHRLHGSHFWMRANVPRGLY